MSETIFPEKVEKIITNLSSAEFPHGVVKVKNKLGTRKLQFYLNDVNTKKTVC